ncbi:imidazoleglycerol-phosphate dehydratase [Desulfurella multipotens]|uniref:Imidazoleglycerol-phosphate dehydratase n=1 Tax=Desulfurella multipotens TaxID=79269 RepID=A0A1G6ITW2_9BACT|nr:imidazoleglycerol-phosphate dehydratase HisB [Desulfurella multipotens]AHF97509.1 imidazoleglycerol-phosphate dehydratase [Desulfurella acetivorans A63]SDC09850.1 imidazoleglycerol-phosphate dehydratase [Desulfurella multipotens]
MTKIERKTKETNIKIELSINGSAKYNIDTGIGFFNHMLETLSRHSNFDLNVKASGDIDVDYHHLVEDVGIVLGQAFFEETRKANFERFGYSIIPMDDALVLSSVDLANRVYLMYDCQVSGAILNFDVELIEEFWRAFVSNARIVLHIKQLAGYNKHHIVEAVFKSVAKSLKSACMPSTEILSTKLTL